MDIKYINTYYVLHVVQWIHYQRNDLMFHQLIYENMWNNFKCYTYDLTDLITYQMSFEE